MAKKRKNGLVAVQQRLKCLELRARGKSYLEIVDEINETAAYGDRINVATVHKYVSNALGSLRAIARETNDERRELARFRLDKMYDRLSDGIEMGSLDHIETGLKVEKARRELEGLNAPTETNNKITVAHVLAVVPVSPDQAREMLRKELGESF